MSATVDIIIPVYNAAVLLQRCLVALDRCTDPQQARVLVIDDASPDPAIAPLLDAWAEQREVQIRASSCSTVSKRVTAAESPCVLAIIPSRTMRSLFAPERPHTSFSRTVCRGADVF